MNRMKLAPALVIALFAVPGAAFAEGGAGSSRTPAPAQPAKAAVGFVSIACNPGCESVLVDGRAIGPSPVVRVAVTEGAHEITLRRKGYEQRKLSVSVKKGQTASLNIKLSQQAAPPAEPPADIAARVEARRVKAIGYLSLECVPGCDQVILDGKRKLGPAPHESVSVPPGKHEITLQRKGAPDRTLSLVVASGRTTDLRIAMPTKAELASPPPKSDKPAKSR